MAHCLSQEQVLDIRARLFSNHGRVTVSSVREALRVVGQDELSDDEILRLVGTDELHKLRKPSSTGSPSSSPMSGGRKSDGVGKKKKKKKEKRVKIGKQFFLASSSDSDDDDDDHHGSDDDDHQHRRGAGGGGGRASLKLDENHVFTSAVDFPQFLQRLNRLVQDRETVKELKNLFYVLAKFAHDRREKIPVPGQHAAAAAAAKKKATDDVFGTAGGGGVDEAGLHPQSDPKELERFLHIRAAVDHKEDPLVHATQAVLGNHNNNNNNHHHNATGGGNNNASSSSSANFNNNNNNSVASGAGGDGSSSSANLFATATAAQSSSSNLQRAASGGASALAASSTQQQQQSQQQAGGGAAAASFYTPEEIVLMNSDRVLTREELRNIMSEVLDSTVRRSTGIDHVMAGLMEGENFVTCDRFVDLILRGGPEVVALPFLL